VTGSNQLLEIYLFRGATLVCSYSFGGISSAMEFAPSIAYLDTPTAGTYAYQIQAASANGGSVAINNCVLILYEL
jgi:hypothetical protein